MMHELLTPEEMAQADRLAIKAGPFDGMALMRRAGAAVAAVVLERYPAAARVHVLCGPGNNGGDGYVVARLLQESGVAVSLFAEAPPKAGSDAALAAGECPVPQNRWLGSIHAGIAGGRCTVRRGPFEAGWWEVAQTIGRFRERADAAVVAMICRQEFRVNSGTALGTAFRVDATVTFFRKKPGHLLYPGREHCGEMVVAHIGIRVMCCGDPSGCLGRLTLWRQAFPRRDRYPQICAWSCRRLFRRTLVDGGRAAFCHGRPRAPGRGRSRC